MALEPLVRLPRREPPVACRARSRMQESGRAALLAIETLPLACSAGRSSCSLRLQCGAAGVDPESVPTKSYGAARVPLSAASARPFQATRPPAGASQALVPAPPSQRGTSTAAASRQSVAPSGFSEAPRLITASVFGGPNGSVRSAPPGHAAAPPPPVLSSAGR